MNKNYKIMGYSVSLGDRTDIRNQIESILNKNERRCAWLACLNPHSYAVAKSDVDFQTALHSCDWLIPDGIGIVMVSRLRRGPVRVRVTGSDIFESVMDSLEKRGGSVFFLGGTNETLSAIQRKVNFDYPSVRIAGMYSPPFKNSYSSREKSYMVARINSANADVLWVGLTAPKQEKLISDLKEKLDVQFAGAVGAVFDFYSGGVKRSHPVFQNTGLEWLPRLVKQPKRLWRRMFVSAPIFLIDFIKESLAFRQL